MRDLPWGELGRRIAVAAVGIPVAVLLVRAGGWALAALLALAAVLGAREFYALAEARGVRPLGGAGAAAALLLVVAAAARPSFAGAAPWAYAIVVMLVLGSLSAAVLRGASGAPLSEVSATVAGAVYTGGTLSFALLLRHLPDTAAGPADPWHGTFLVLFVLAVTWLGDTCAYFAGKLWGRRKLLPSVSPGKTVVGAVAGLVGAAAAALACGLLLLPSVPGFGLSLPVVAGIGVLVGGGAQLGDLAESVLKRGAGVKDSGSLLPGHGGVLDRLDALYFTLPLSYALLALAGRLP